MRRVLFACVVSIGLAACLVQPGRAIEASGIGMLPANPRADAPRSSSIIIHTTTPGAKINDAVTVANNSGHATTLSVYATDSQVSSDGAFACAQQVEVPQKVGRWVQLEATTLTLQPGKSKTIPLEIVMPQRVESGEYNGCIVVQEASPAPAEAQKGIALQFRSAMRVALTVPGNLHASISLTDVVPTALKEITQLKVTARNSGSVSVDAVFRVKFNTIFGLAGPAHDMGSYTVFPDVSSVFNFEVPNPFWGGWYKTTVEATYHEPKASGGMLSVETVRTSEPTLLFVMPQPLALFLEAIILFGVVFGGAALLRRRHTRQLNNEFGTSYTVKAGDTIETIAREHGTSWRRLAAQNNLKAPYTLTSGMTIQLPYRSVETPPRET